MSDKQLTNSDFLMISRDLEIHHAVFSKIWNVGKPVFTDKIPTAAVSFDKEGHHLDFKFNPEFWDSLKPYERNFIICHECLHIMLNHGVRLKELNSDIGNISADVVINEMLVQAFGFDRGQLEWVGPNGCWMNTVFTDPNVLVEKDRSMEYYYNILKKDCIEQIKQLMSGAGGSGGMKIVDDHDSFKEMDTKGLEDVLGDILGSMNDGEKQSLNNCFSESNEDELKECSKEAGTMPGNLEITVKCGLIKKKRKWETVIKKWMNSVLKEADKDHEQWARINRRFVGISSTMSNMFLPSEMEIEEKDEVKKKIKVVFFQDTSGSCVHLAERFFKAAKSLPTDRFEIELYCFDTRCYKTSLESGKLYGFGGTSFSILEDEIMSICKNDLSNYPKAIFVITDGYGDNIHPRKPKNWHWFLSENYPCYIPSACNIHKLSEFE